MLLCSGPRTNTIQSWVNPSTVGFFLTWARWPSSSFTCTAPCKAQRRRVSVTKDGSRVHVSCRCFFLKHYSLVQQRLCSSELKQQVHAYTRRAELLTLQPSCVLRFVSWANVTQLLNRNIVRIKSKLLNKVGMSALPAQRLLSLTTAALQHSIGALAKTFWGFLPKDFPLSVSEGNLTSLLFHVVAAR